MPFRKPILHALIFLLTCEHGGNLLPPEYELLFGTAEKALETHRGYDLGALDLFFFLKPLADHSCFSETSRLLVELNRSLHHPKLFSEYTEILSGLEKRKILDSYYFPYREKVEKEIEKALQEGEKVLHLSVHSFTPKLNGVERNADIGLLYDPSRKAEKAFCIRLKEALMAEDPELSVRFNYPYLGQADGFPTYLRKLFPDNYSGIELEVNQKLSSDNRMEEGLKQLLFDAIGKAL